MLYIILRLTIELFIIRQQDTRKSLNANRLHTYLVFEFSMVMIKPSLPDLLAMQNTEEQ